MQYRRFVHVGRSCDQSLDDAPKCGVDSKFRDYSKRNHPTLSDSRLQRICKSQICGRAAMCMFRKESKHCGSLLPKTSTQSNECLAIDAQRHRHHKHPKLLCTSQASCEQNARYASTAVSNVCSLSTFSTQLPVHWPTPPPRSHLTNVFVNLSQLEPPEKQKHDYMWTFGTPLPITRVTILPQPPTPSHCHRSRALPRSAGTRCLSQARRSMAYQPIPFCLRSTMSQRPSRTLNLSSCSAPTLPTIPFSPQPPANSSMILTSRLTSHRSPMALQQPPAPSQHRTSHPTPSSHRQRDIRTRRR